MKNITEIPDRFDNETIQNINCRRAIRSYTSETIKEDMINKILDAGRMAPSAINKQPWHFYVISDPKLIRLFSQSILSSSKMSMIKAGVKEVIHTITHPASFHLKDGLDFFKADDPVFHNAPLVIFITADRKNEWSSLDIGMCAQNMMLAAKSYGIDSCPIGFAKFIEHSDKLDLLQIPDSEEVKLALIFGYRNEDPVFHERKRDNVNFVKL